MAVPAEYTLAEIAAALGATLEGDPSRVVSGVAPLESAGPTQIAYVADARHREAARASRAGAFVAPPGVTDLPAPILRCRAPRLALADLLLLFYPASAPAPGIHPAAVVATDARVEPTAAVGALAVVESGARIGPEARVWPLAYVGPRAEVGRGCVLYPHAVLTEGVRLGERVVVHAGAVIGSDGFGYAFDGARHRKIPQVGGVRIEDDVEIGANTTIDRATLGETVIGRGSKIDNLVQIAHNVGIGEHSLIAAQVGIAGSARVGRRVVLAGQVGIADHVRVGDDVEVGAQAGVAGDVAPGQKFWGTPARPLTEAKRIAIAQGQLPDLARRLRGIERRLARLEARLGVGEDAREERHDG